MIRFNSSECYNLFLTATNLNLSIRSSNNKISQSCVAEELPTFF